MRSYLLLHLFFVVVCFVFCFLFVLETQLLTDIETNGLVRLNIQKVWESARQHVMSSRRSYLGKHSSDVMGVVSLLCLEDTI